MKKIFCLSQLIFLTFLFACNSNSSTTDNNDSTSKTQDSSHNNMNMSSVQPIPDIPSGARVYFKNLKDGQTVSSPVKVEMGAEGINVDTAGVIKSGSGHHHLLIDASPVDSGQVVPKDSTHLHFGKAQKETEISLKPGKHTLSLQFADGLHRSYGSKLSSTVNVVVKK